MIEKIYVSVLNFSLAMVIETTPGRGGGGGRGGRGEEVGGRGGRENLP